MKALALFSGGLDSMLATKVISDLGVEVIALYIDIGFGGKSDVDALLKERAEKAGASFMKIDVRSEYLRDILLIQSMDMEKISILASIVMGICSKSQKDCSISLMLHLSSRERF